MNITGKTRIMAVGLSALMAISVAGGAFALGPGGGGSGAPAANGTAPAGDGGRHHVKMQAAKGLIQSAATTLNMDPKELAKQLKDGNTTIAAIATANGVPVQTVIDNAVTAANTAIDKAVTDGKLTAEKAAKIKTELPARIAKIVNEGRQHHTAKPAR